MSLESFLSKKLRSFSIIDLALVKLVYLAISFLVFHFYSTLGMIGWWFWLAIAIFAAIPLWIHEFSHEGSIPEKIDNYIKTNNPSNQVLLFFSVFFFGLMLCTLAPVLASLSWWWYVVIGLLLAIKPATNNIYW